MGCPIPGSPWISESCGSNDKRIGAAHVQKYIDIFGAQFHEGRAAIASQVATNEGCFLDAGEEASSFTSKKVETQEPGNVKQCVNR